MTATLRDRAIDTAAAWAEESIDLADLSWEAIAEGVITAYETALADHAPALVLEHEHAAVLEACAYVLAVAGIREDLRSSLSSVVDRLREETE